MRLYLSSKKSSDFSIRLTIGGPYQRELELNYVTKDEKIIVIPTGEWIEELKIFPYARVNSVNLRASLVGIDDYVGLFVDKYGQEHFHRYFSGCAEVVLFEPVQGEPKYDSDILGAVFDSITDKYFEELNSNWVQKYMREQTVRVLERYARDGSTILDLGCGPDSEVLRIHKKIYTTEVDVSEAALKKSREIHEKDGKDIRWILQRNNSEFLGNYDIVFSSYGYLNIETLPSVAHLLDTNLKVGGLFIGSFMNRYGLFDLLLSLFQGRGKYIGERISGRLTVNDSRYNTISFPRAPGYFDELKGMKHRYRRGVCTILPSYNYKRLIVLAERSGFMGLLDELIGSFPLIWAISDYVIFVYEKTGPVKFE